MKLFIGFGLVVILMLAVSIFNINRMTSLSATYGYVIDFPINRLTIIENVKNASTDMRLSLISSVSYLALGDTASANDSSEDAQNLYNQTVSYLNEYSETFLNDATLTPEMQTERLGKAKVIQNNLNTYKQDRLDPILTAVENGDLDTANSLIVSTEATVSTLDSSITDLLNTILSTADNLTANAASTAARTVMLVAIILAVIVIISIIIVLLITNAITKPINALVSVTNDVVEGRLNINAAEVHNDEIGQLTLAVYKLKDIILSLIKEMDDMSNEFAAGDVEARIDTSKFSGSYKDVANGLNSMIGTVMSELSDYIACIKEFGKGNFKAVMPQLPGKKAIMNESIEAMRENLKSVAGQIGKLVDEASVGNLNERADARALSGDWAELLGNMNKLMNAISTPINEAEDILSKISAGNFDNTMKGEYQGSFLVVKEAVNETVVNTSSYLNEISEILDKIANNDLRSSIERDYVGKYSDIKRAINNILTKFNEIIYDIMASSEQVAAGAKQISESSANLARGAADQSASIEELNSTLSSINDTTTVNSENAQHAESLAVTSKTNAQKGDDDMLDMLNSMHGISTSSDNISKIMKVIDDIAFQTNILALNAAVEAARAGEHGKGFAVVAEEVRSLAGRSQTAAKETAALIEESIRNVNEGTKIADHTANALRTIVDDVEKVSGIITSMAEASHSQADALSQIMNTVTEITHVVQTNSATSEESASASQELSSQSDILKELVAVFKLKKARSL